MMVRAEDHALLQPMYQATLSGSGTEFTASAQRILTADESAPPAVTMKG
jgi:branched-chain amino acid transport system substrate-binding protein